MMGCLKFDNVLPDVFLIGHKSLLRRYESRAGQPRGPSVPRQLPVPCAFMEVGKAVLFPITAGKRLYTGQSRGATFYSAKYFAPMFGGLFSFSFELSYIGEPSGAPSATRGAPPGKTRRIPLAAGTRGRPFSYTATLRPLAGVWVNGDARMRLK